LNKVGHFKDFLKKSTFSIFFGNQKRTNHNESYKNIQKSPHIARKKVALLGCQKSCFFIFAPKRYLSQGKPSKKNLCTTTRQELSESPSYDLT
jgi:hypothetical protein